MTRSTEPGSAVVVGASLAGLLSAAALSRQGYEVTVLERDRLPAEPALRRGVPQGSQIHVLLHRGLLAMEGLLPGLRQGLLDRGAICFDSGRMPWLGEFGWLTTGVPGFDIVSCTRPLLEHHVRERVQRLSGVTIQDDSPVAGLRREAGAWRVLLDGHADAAADLVVDASGRGSRLAHWLQDLGLTAPPPEVLDARLGYACRLYRATTPLPVDTGIVIANVPTTGRGGLALPVEDGHWIVGAGGNAPWRPSRDAAELDAFLAGLPDPAVRELVDLLEPVSDVTIHRQTGNRRRRYAAMPGWPAGLLVVGDSGCAFNPVYGQGITVAARQAEELDAALAAGSVPDRRLQHRLAAVAELPWALATAEDRRQPASHARSTPAQRASSAWTAQLGRMVATGDVVATSAFSRVYHMMAPPSLLLHPRLVLGAARSAVRPGRPNPRPEPLQALSAVHRRAGAA